MEDVMPPRLCDSFELRSVQEYLFFVVPGSPSREPSVAAFRDTPRHQPVGLTRMIWHNTALPRTLHLTLLGDPIRARDCSNPQYLCQAKRGQ